MVRIDSSHRLAGLLAPVFALRRPEDLGIGDTRAVRDAVEFCARHGFSVLQILPIHETVGDHSPYNPISSRALSPALLTLGPEEVPGLTGEMVDQAAPKEWLQQLRAGRVRHNSVQPLKLQILLWAFKHFKREFGPASDEVRDFAAFREVNCAWLRPYSLFRFLVREYEGNTDWRDWRPEHQALERAEAWFVRHRDADRMETLREGLEYVQWVAHRQWSTVKVFAERLGIRLMGEMSFGVSRASVDVWAHPDLFDLEWNMGTRPIVYFDTNKDSERWGQNWGFPAYAWDRHRAQSFRWVRQRIEGERQYFHICRLDHLRGYFRGYMFPWAGGAEHAEFASLTDDEVRGRTSGRMPRFVPGPDEDPTAAERNEEQGRQILAAIQDAAGDMALIGEIMGNMRPYMRRVLDELGIASLTFPHLERNPDRSLQTAETYRALSLAAYANHDHAPLAAHYLHLVKQAGDAPDSDAARDLQALLRLAGWTAPPPPTLNDALLEGLQRSLFHTPCYLAVLMTSDLLGLPQRYNLPGSYGRDTWSERLELSLADYEQHAVFGERILTAARLLRESGRRPAPPAAPVDELHAKAARVAAASGR